MDQSFELASLDATFDCSTCISTLRIYIVFDFSFGIFVAFWIVLSFGSYFSFEHVILRGHVDPLFFVEFEFHSF